MAEQAFMENKPPITIPVAEIEALQRYDVTCRLCRGDAEQEVEPDRQGCWYKAAELVALVDKYKESTDDR